MYEKFDKFTTKILNDIVVIILIFVIGFTTAAGIFYNIFDFKYATEKDYEPLYQTQQAIINNFDTVYTFSNTDIDITDSNIIVYIFGDDCYLETHFDKAKAYQNTEKIDKTDPIGVTILLFIIASSAGSCAFFLLFIIALVIIDTVLCKIDKSKKAKEKEKRKERDIDN